MYGLEKYNLTELKNMAEQMELPGRRSKAEMIRDISKAFSEYEEYKKQKLDKYTRCEQLGQKGKEGVIYRVVDSAGKEYAMKTFRSKKASTTLKREYILQKKAAKKGVSPKVYDYDTISKYIVMQKMDCLLIDEISRKKGVLSKKHQLRIIEIFKKLDEARVFHGDANILNYMLKDNEVMIIDFGFAKEITPALCKKLKTERPNSELMLIGLILKLKEGNLQMASYKHLLKNVSPEMQKKYGL